MQNVTNAFKNAILSPIRSVNAKVELYNGSTLLATYTQNDRIKTIDIQRTVDKGRFFGMCASQRLNLHLIDKERELSYSTANSIKVYFGVNNEFVGFPTFYITEVNRDEKTNELSITAYDLINKASAFTEDELELTAPYTVQDVAEAIASTLGTTIKIIDVGESETCFSTSYASGTNFDGAETLREILPQIAEVTQTVCFVNYENKICFRRLSSTSAQTISKEDYFNFKSSGNRRLQTICNATELGDNTSVSTSLTGSTQYVRDNPFWELRDDIATLLQDALDVVGDMTIGVFDCSWRGTPALEIGDKVSLTAKDNSTFASYILNDTIKYNGSFSESCSWDYDEEEEETPSNPVTLGDKLKQTYAKVDKANKEITIVASEVNDAESEIARLQIATNDITATVKETSESLTEDLNKLSNEVNTKLTSEQVGIQISEALENGVDKVVTSTGFTFDKDGLTVSKTDSEMTTNIDENGMSVFKSGTEVLTADNKGVNAYNLHARTYLIIGKYSRFEDYEPRRTGCFWIGERRSKNFFNPAIITDTSPQNLDKDGSSHAKQRTETGFKARCFAYPVIGHSWVVAHMRPSTTYTIRCTRTLTHHHDTSTYTYKANGNNGLYLYDGTKGSWILPNCTTLTEVGQSVTTTNTFTTPADLYDSNYDIRAYTQRWYTAQGVTTPVCSDTIDFSEIMIVLGGSEEMPEEYEPYWD